MRAVKGIKFPATIADLKHQVQRNYDNERISDRLYNNAMEFLAGWDDDEYFELMPDVMEALNSVQKTFTGSVRRIDPNKVATPDRDYHIPLGRGEIEADREAADRIAEIHMENIGRMGGAREEEQEEEEEEFDMEAEEYEEERKPRRKNE